MSRGVLTQLVHFDVKARWARASHLQSYHAPFYAGPHPWSMMGDRSRGTIPSRCNRSQSRSSRPKMAFYPQALMTAFVS